MSTQSEHPFLTAKPGDILPGVSIYNRAGTLHKWRKGSGVYWFTCCAAFKLPSTEIVGEDEALRMCKRCFPANLTPTGGALS